MTEPVPEFDRETYDVVTEGRASILYPKGNKVFYNPIQQFNRDTSVVAIRAWAELFQEQKRKKQEAYAANKRKRVLGGKTEESPAKTVKQESAQDVSDAKTVEDVVNEVTEDAIDSVEIKTESTEVKTEDTEVKTEDTEAKSEEPTQTKTETTQGSGDNVTSSTGGTNTKPQGNQERFVEILEVLSASGLRAIRYGKEIPQARRIVANDMSASAVQSIRENVEFNGLQNVVVPNKDDANALMFSRRENHVHVVDLDPYGSATPFIDAAVNCVQDNGLLLVTCTDLGVLAGNSHPEKCFSMYGGQNVYTGANHESALRLVLGMVSQAAGRYGMAIEPLLSLSIDFYVRCFIKVRRSAQLVKHNASKSMVVYFCSQCHSHTTQPLGRATDTGKPGMPYKYGYAQGPTTSPNCEHCGHVNHIGGPMWGGPIHNKEYIDRMLAIADTLDESVYGTVPRMKGMLTMARDELDTPFYLQIPHMSSIARVQSPPIKLFVSALFNAGYDVSFTHAKAGAIKTNAPMAFVWDVVRAWMVKAGSDLSKLKPGSPGAHIVERKDPKQAAAEVDFKIHHRALAMESLRKSKLLRFQTNPEANWGPKARASKN